MKLDDLVPFKICTKLVWTILSLFLSPYVLSLSSVPVAYTYRAKCGALGGQYLAQVIPKTEHSW